MKRSIRNLSQPNPSDTLPTKVLKPDDPRNNSRKFEAAKRKGIYRLVKRETWTFVYRKEVPKGSNILNRRNRSFLLAVKNKGTEDEAYKARFVVQDHRDKEKNLLAHNSPTFDRAL